MPMVVYTEDEVIEKCNEAEALGASRAAAERDKAMAENTAMRKKLNDCRDAIKRIVDSPTITNVCGWYPEIEAAKLILETRAT